MLCHTISYRVMSHHIISCHAIVVAVVTKTAGVELTERGIHAPLCRLSGSSLNALMNPDLGEGEREREGGREEGEGGNKM